MTRLQRVQCPVSSVQCGVDRRPGARLSLNAQRSTLNARLSTRTGTTLTEVLIAILVMSVGVLAVMSLFPIAFLRSAQATQLTNATILKMRAEALVDMFGLTSDVFIPQPAEGHVTRCLIDPIGWQDVASSLDQQPQQGVRFWNAHQYGVRNNGGILERYRYIPTIPLLNIPALRTEFVNLPGLANVRDVLPVPLRRLGLATGSPISSFAPLPPYPFNPLRSAVFASRQSALGAVALPDTLETQLTTEPAGNSLVSVDLDITEVVDPEDFAQLESLWLADVPMRLILIHSNGKQSQLREIPRRQPAPAAPGPSPFSVATGPTGQVGRIAWLAAQPLPASFDNNLSEVRVETSDPRYTWMLTVRKRGISGGSSTEIDCVVFFNRAADDPEEELVHETVPLAQGDPVSAEDVPYTVKLKFSPYPSDPQRVPPLKRGGFVFDPTQARWYRVQEILANDATHALLRLDRRPREIIQTLVVPRGVVQVFPLKTRVDKGLD